MVQFVRRLYSLHNTLLALLLLLTGAIVFYRLPSATLYSWDEARHAVNGLEMLLSRNFLQNHFVGARDLWNLKPPLGSWLITLSFSLLGPGELALRIWSALAGIATVVLVYIFGKKYHSKNAGLVGGYALLAIAPFWGEHGARTGDYDILLSLCLLGLLYLFFIPDTQRTRKSALLIGGIIGIGILLKSIAGALPLLVLGILSLKKNPYQRSLKEWGLIVLMLTLTLSIWVIPQLIQEPTFFLTMFSQDVIARTTSSLEGQAKAWWFYGPLLWERMGIPLCLVTIISGIACLGKQIPIAYKGILLWSIGYLILISAMMTKMFWYPLPLYPLFAVLIGVAVQRIPKSTYPAIVACLLLFTLHFPHTTNGIVYPNHHALRTFQSITEETTPLFLHNRSLTPQHVFYAERSCKCTLQSYTDIQKLPKERHYILTPHAREKEELLSTGKYTIFGQQTPFFLLQSR